MPTTDIWRAGPGAAASPRTALRAGPLSLVLERGELAFITLGEVEVLRRIYVAIRDRNWGTVPPVLSEVREEIGEESFRVSFLSVNRERDIDFSWRALLTGEPDGTVTFEMDGEAHTTFTRNRIGFCVLHPDAAAGARCRIVHPDGTQEEPRFPEHIAPHQPFREVQALAHEVAPGQWAELTFEGEIFETEDQRNWTDASFKTYCTPLRLPFPVEVAAGTRVRQKLTLRVRSEGGGRAESPSGRPHPPSPLSLRERGDSAGEGHHVPTILELRLNEPGQPLAAIGLGVASHGEPLTAREVGLLRALRPSHLRVDLQLAGANWEAVLHRAAAEAIALGARLEVALHLSGEAKGELRELANALPGAGAPIARFLVFRLGESSTTEPWVALAREVLAPAAPGVPLAAGTNAYFTELNRGPSPTFADAAVYSVNPQIHAFDNVSLVETLRMQALTVENARRLAGGRPVVVSPVTLKPRFNAVATGPLTPTPPGELPEPVDPRQMSLFGAAWTLGSLMSLLPSGAASLTYYETTGWRGVLEREEGSPLPVKFPSLPGGAFPLYHALADVLELGGGRVLASGSRSPWQTEGLTLEKDGQRRTVLANLTGEPGVVVLAGAPARGQLHLLDETSAERACREPERFRVEEGVRVAAVEGELRLELLPYATARIDWEST